MFLSYPFTFDIANKHLTTDITPKDEMNNKSNRLTSLLEGNEPDQI